VARGEAAGLQSLNRSGEIRPCHHKRLQHLQRLRVPEERTPHLVVERQYDLGTETWHQAQIKRGLVRAVVQVPSTRGLTVAGIVPLPAR
jgi:hypothetical protein